MMSFCEVIIAMLGLYQRGRCEVEREMARSYDQGGYMDL